MENTKLGRKISITPMLGFFKSPFWSGSGVECLPYMCKHLGLIPAQKNQSINQKIKSPFLKHFGEGTHHSTSLGYSYRRKILFVNRKQVSLDCYTDFSLIVIQIRIVKQLDLKNLQLLNILIVNGNQPQFLTQ